MNKEIELGQTNQVYYYCSVSQQCKLLKGKLVFKRGLVFIKDGEALLTMTHSNILAINGVKVRTLEEVGVPI